MEHRQPDKPEVTEDHDCSPVLSSTVAPCCQDGHVLSELATRRLEPWRSVLGRAVFILFVAATAGLQMHAQHIDTVRADLELDVCPVPESPHIQGGDIGLAFVCDAPAERQTCLESAAPPGECEGGGVRIEHPSDKGVIHFLQRNDIGLQTLRNLTQPVRVLGRAPPP